MPPQTLFNPDYTFYSGSVVNNPHSYGVHRFAGAYPPSTYHWPKLGSAEFRTSHKDAATMYYGKNLVGGIGKAWGVRGVSDQHGAAVRWGGRVKRARWSLHVGTQQWLGRKW
jgi:hypothetical protein